jgi:hypothetical protein
VIITFLENILINEPLNDLKIAGDCMDEAQAARAFANGKHPVVSGFSLALNSRAKHRIGNVSDSGQMF